MLAQREPRGALVIFVADAEAGGRMLRAGRLACPGCGGWLRVWTAARERAVSTLGGERITDA
jgi:hypothetical protein